MAYEISREALRAAQLSDDLRESESPDDPGVGGGGVWRMDVEHRPQPDLGLGAMAPPVRVRNRWNGHI